VSEAEELYLARILHTILNACPANTHEIDAMQVRDFQRQDKAQGFERRCQGSSLHLKSIFSLNACSANH